MAALTPDTVRYDAFDCEEPITEKNFQAAEDLQEGISGRRSIDSSYENVLGNNKTVVNAPRSQANPVDKELDPETARFAASGNPCKY